MGKEVKYFHKWCSSAGSLTFSEKNGCFFSLVDALKYLS